MKTEKISGLGKVAGRGRYEGGGGGILGDMTYCFEELKESYFEF